MRVTGHGPRPEPSGKVGYLLIRTRVRVYGQVVGFGIQPIA